ncbi:MAG: hypothetical protein K8963_03725 [Proteobacteria bacterium]|nr:hypothetical protein [Pseudomonadota bacterium]
MLQRQRRCISVLLTAVFIVALSAVVPAAAERSSGKLKHFDLHRSKWPDQPTAAVVSKLKPLQSIFKHYRNQRSTIEIRYPGGRVGRAWASEVQGWLVALGIPVNDVVLSVGVDSSDRLRLAVIPKF